MQVIRIYQIDAFTGRIFGGNPAAVCPLKSWLREEVMQRIAYENNVSETAFYVQEGEGFRIRWFTPTTEVDLCGHATLAAAHVLVKHEGWKGESVHFFSKSGLLKVFMQNGLLTLDFPSSIVKEVSLPSLSFSRQKDLPLAYFSDGVFGIAVFNSEEIIGNFDPDFFGIESVEEKVVVITSKGKESDFVSRVFGPKVGLLEDPVTGSAHTRLVPYWAGVLGKRELHARQISSRGGDLYCSYTQDRVFMSGNAVTYLIGEIYI